MSHRKFSIPALLAVTVTCVPALAAAQSLGTFRWQLQPYCNVVTFTVVASGPSYLLTGADNFCGGGALGAATGTAVQNPDGSIGMGFSVVSPTGAAAHITARVTLPTVSGTWQDADGHSGPFIFDPPAPVGAPRPAPSRSSGITSAQLAAAIFAGTGTAATVARSDHHHDDRYLTRAQTDAIVAAAGAAIVDGPGVNAPTTLIPQDSFVAETVNSPKTGRLIVTKSFALSSFTCSGSPRLNIFLTLDEVPILNSAVSTNSTFQGQLTGFTTDAVPAGSHTIRVAVRCVSGNLTASTTHTVSRASVIVLP